AVAGHQVRRHVDGDLATERPDREQFRRCVFAAAQSRAHPGDELLRLERLDHIVVGTRFEAEDDIYGVRFGGQHHDRYARLRADGATDVDAAHAREHEVEQHDVRPYVPKRGEGPLTVGYERGHKALGPQHDAEHLGEGGVIVDHQHTGSHGLQYSIS